MSNIITDLELFEGCSPDRLDQLIGEAAEELKGEQSGTTRKTDQLVPALLEKTDVDADDDTRTIFRWLHLSKISDSELDEQLGAKPYDGDEIHTLVAPLLEKYRREGLREPNKSTLELLETSSFFGEGVLSQQERKTLNAFQRIACDPKDVDRLGRLVKQVEYKDNLFKDHREIAERIRTELDESPSRRSSEQDKDRKTGEFALGFFRTVLVKISQAQKQRAMDKWEALFGEEEKDWEVIPTKRESLIALRKEHKRRIEEGKDFRDQQVAQLDALIRKKLSQ